MKQIILVLFLLFFSLLSAKTVVVDMQQVQEAKFQLIKTIPYGTTDGKVGLFMPTQNEELPFGVNGITGDAEKLFLIDNMNKRVVSIALKTNLMKNEFSLPSTTFKNISFLNSEIVLYNVKKEQLYRQNGTPIALKTPLKITRYPYTKFLGANRVKIVSSPEKFLTLSFSDVALQSFLLISEDSAGRIHAIIDVGNDTRYHIALDQTGRVLSKTKLPNSELFRPETDIFITPEGTIYFIAGDRGGLRLFKGGVK